MTKTYDVIIVGAGPGGSAAAYDLAAEGLDVLLLDRSAFPRPKACAGGITIKALQALRYSIEPIVRTWVFDFAAGLRTEHSELLRGRGAVCAMTVRSEFDLFCLHKTVEAGAAFEIARVSDLDEDDRAVTLTTSKGVRRAKFVIGADGANGRISRLIATERNVSNGLAIEATIPNSIEAMRFDFGVVDGGYGWAFPKGDHTNVGLYTSLDGMPLVKADLHRYLAELFSGYEISEFRGQQVPIVRSQSKVCSRRVALVGDAAGLVDPLLGEGIYNAIRSGQLAARTVSQALKEARPRVDPEYEQSLQPIMRDLRACLQAADKFYRHLELGHRILVSPIAANALMRGFAAGKTFHYTTRMFPLLAFSKVVRPKKKVASRPSFEANPSYLGSDRVLREYTVVDVDGGT